MLHTGSLRRKLIIAQDIPRIFAQQPLKGPSLPFTYLIPSPSTTLRPPTLRYGWRLGHDKLMDIAMKHFKNVVQYRFAPSTEGMGIEKGDETDDETEDYQEEQPNVLETLLNLNYIFAIQKLLGVPTWVADHITIQPLYDCQFKSKWGITVGTNYPPGIMRQDFMVKLQEILETDEPPMWYLDYSERQWYRLPSLPKPRGERS